MKGSSFALSPYKVFLCALVNSAEHSLTTSSEQLDVLSNHVS